MSVEINREINERKDVNELVLKFYAKVRKDDLLGPIFNKIIPDEMWPSHLEKLTDFWETNLFGIPKFKGNPAAAHRDVDREENHSIQQEHFGRWLMLWFQTIDENFTGNRSIRAKEAARGMASGLFMAMWNNKPATSKNA